MLGQEFNILTERLETTEAQRRRFVSDASHELKTPLASIRLLSDSISQSADMDSTTMREFVADIGSEAERLQRTTEKLLDLSRRDDGVQPAVTIVDLQQAVHGTLHLLRPLADRSSVTITCLMSEGVTVRASEDDIYHIVFNLVENAIKYNLPGGDVTVRVEARGDQSVLSAAETVFGSPEGDRPYIFNRFYRVDKAGSREHGGSGRGLSIVHDAAALYGGVVPEIASRKHIEAIAALTDQALKESGVEKKDIDAVAATYAPGLIGAVLVGLNFAKSAAYALNVPLIPVHHIRGHIAANYLAFPELEPPFLALCMSGGNTLIVDVRDYTDFALLGATRDDAAGECFDKAARVLGLPYPGGAAMDKLAHESGGGVYELPRAKIDGCPLDMSFSGLKTAVVNLAHNAEQTEKQLDRAALARDFTQAVVDELVPRAMLAMQQSGRKVLVAAGGVAANSFIRAELEKECRKHGCRLYMPPLKLCGDNGAMIGAQGYYEYLAGARADWALNAYATRDIDDPIV